MAQVAENAVLLPNEPTPPSSPDYQNATGEHWQNSAATYERNESQRSIQQSPTKFNTSLKRKAVPSRISAELQVQQVTATPVTIKLPESDLQDPHSVQVESRSTAEYSFNDESRRSSGSNYSNQHQREYSLQSLPIRRRPVSSQAQVGGDLYESRAPSADYPQIEEDGSYLEQQNGTDVGQSEGLQYHAFEDNYNKHTHHMSQPTNHSRQSSGSGGGRPVSQQLDVPRARSGQRPTSSYSDGRGRTLSPLSANGSDHGSPNAYARDLSASRRSPSGRPVGYVDELNNVPYSQQVAPGSSMINRSLQNIVGNGASRLDIKKTLEMYRANIKKDTESPIQYEFAMLMINTARDATPDSGLEPGELINEAKHILQRLADRAYPFAQYYLGDGYFSGLFNKDKPDFEKAFSLFTAASKHGHAEAGYRVALCYEFGWGTTKSYPKAVQFYRTSAAKNHPGAATRLGLACIHGDMGLNRQHYREGVKWLKRAQESADIQYNSAPYELGMLHLTGHGDDIFKDPAYSAQLFTQSAELGHAQANFLMGQAYENGLYGCPKDAALSVHFYNGAAVKGHPEAMMALCAWYMVGAEPVMEKDEAEAYAWAVQAAEKGTHIHHNLSVAVWTLTFSFNRFRQSRIRCRILHRNGHRLPSRPSRGKCLVCPRS